MSVKCRKCGEEIKGAKFGSASTGWEHPFTCPRDATPALTVAGLIEVLQALPPDLPVWFISSDPYEYGPVTKVEIDPQPRNPVAFRAPDGIVWVS